MATAVVIVAVLAAWTSWSGGSGDHDSDGRAATAAVAKVLAGSQPQPDGATACSAFIEELLGGSPVHEEESAAVARAASYAGVQLRRRLETDPHSEDAWLQWRAAGVQVVEVELVPRAASRPGSAAGSLEGKGRGVQVTADEPEYLEYTMIRRPRPPGGVELGEQRWDVVCTVGRAGEGWLVTDLADDPQQAAA